MPIRVAFIAAECEPWAKTGGLGDVVDALARALGQLPPGAIAADGMDGLADVFIPRYHRMREPAELTRTTVTIPDASNDDQPIEVGILSAETHGYRLHLVDFAPAFEREGIYGPPERDHPDNAWRFGLLCRAALEVLRTGDRPPDVIHIHDWHAAPALLQRDRGALRDDPVISRAAFMLTVHNLAYHGWTPPEHVGELGLGDGATSAQGGAGGKGGAGAPPTDPQPGIDLLLEAIEGCEVVNTVSPGFAAEALTPEYGMGLDDALRAKGDRFFGILNGLDTELWDPATDRTLAARYSRENRAGKRMCRSALLTELGLDAADPRPVIAMIGRLDHQKGFDLLAEATPELLRRGLRLAILGSGNPEVVQPLRVLANSIEGKAKIALVDRFDRDLARRMYAGADGFVMPSRFEPCGTGQMIAMRYGTPPIVRATGGLRDTVIDVDADPEAGTGFAFEGASPDALVDACERFFTRFGQGGPDWESLLDRGMALDFDWRSSSAPAYLAAYRRAIDLRPHVASR